ncbi:MAG TPA: CbtB domain-containing protein [Amaricoccus sp.]|uniref:CbtB domain-containing protein n=1 Tax=Amaricoccus sp. TaxID=1872485 RepID=UPI002CFACDD8|nr:CbtB domain-containing protein [Amaricoccus sp.]HMQ93116.1 CbtB domain-containing protein [Amaricoccus sp.]HMR53903.1 CbtB domain-containing protein [Amaricoccus sp.]HMR60294.1 CbtB domain-containing protein [Amaricoccus sp.]HMU00928.1 CbtB domain-containing protein [Amaricoccus sp.]
MNTANASSHSTAQTAAPVAIFGLALGLAMVFLTGFSHSTTLHNAAHDTRHAMAFPCH